MLYFGAYVCPKVYGGEFRSATYDQNQSCVHALNQQLCSDNDQLQGSNNIYPQES